MKLLSKSYTKDENGFEGNAEGYVVSTSQENLKNWLEKEANDDGEIYDSIKYLTPNILIIKNINVAEEFQGQGFGSEILCDLINESYTSAAILLCDIGEIQKEGFILEEFYKNNGFETVIKHNNYPLMVFPEKLALQIKSLLELNSENQKKTTNKKKP